MYLTCSPFRFYIFLCLRSEKVQSYYEAEDVKEKLGEIIHKMGFGIHVGWSIEGAVGSHHKIDATYLSPNVNISARLQSATNQYGVT